MLDFLVCICSVDYIPDNTNLNPIPPWPEELYSTLSTISEHINVHQAFTIFTAANSISAKANFMQRVHNVIFSGNCAIEMIDNDNYYFGTDLTPETKQQILDLVDSTNFIRLSEYYPGVFFCEGTYNSPGLILESKFEIATKKRDLCVVSLGYYLDQLRSEIANFSIKLSVLIGDDNYEVKRNATSLICDTVNIPLSIHFCKMNVTELFAPDITLPIFLSLLLLATGADDFGLKLEQKGDQYVLEYSIEKISFNLDWIVVDRFSRIADATNSMHFQQYYNKKEELERICAEEGTEDEDEEMQEAYETSSRTHPTKGRYTIKNNRCVGSTTSHGFTQIPERHPFGLVCKCRNCKRVVT